MLSSAMSLCTPENSAIQKLYIIIMISALSDHRCSVQCPHYMIILCASSEYLCTFQCLYHFYLNCIMQTLLTAKCRVNTCLMIVFPPAPLPLSVKPSKTCYVNYQWPTDRVANGVLPTFRHVGACITNGLTALLGRKSHRLQCNQYCRRPSHSTTLIQLMNDRKHPLAK